MFPSPRWRQLIDEGDADSWAARQAVGEPVTEAQNARDQHAAYALHVARKRPDLDGPWTGTPEPRLDTYRSDLHRVIELTAGGV
ncbi:hypothetical protein [Actinoplanes sp. M2I2]|uniref:hypothetical protein n=1 Tax=Actinoplanes sp. M2I2 TaxID=1734444 RepID=UPI00202234C2|nr:hypothetical protein [Actinoplanes sp. M2I2]